MSVTAGTWSDWYVADGESLVLLDEITVRLSVLGTAVLEAVVAHEGPIGRDRLVEVVVERLGPPPAGTAHALVADAVHVLHGLGIVADADLTPPSAPGSR